LPWVLVLGCAAPSAEHARVAFIRDTLARDNASWLTRDLALLEGKYTKMAADPFDFMRGTASLFYADVARPDPDRPATAFVAQPGAGAVLLAGDPHPENVGTTLPGAAGALGTDGDELRIELNDLDGSGFGPYLLDVRRAGLGVRVLADLLDGCDADCAAEAVASLAAAYCTGIEASNSGQPPSPRCSGDEGSIVADLCASATDDGLRQSILARYTVRDGAERTFALDGSLDAQGRGLLPLTDEEDAQLDRLLAGWAARPPDFRELDRARRYGAGVASFPAIRYVLLWDRGDPSDADDVLVSVREVVDPPSLVGRSVPVPVFFDSNAARIEEAAWLLWSTRDADPNMAGLADGAATFKVTTWSGWFQGFDHLHIAEEWLGATYSQPDLDGMAARVGRTLAGSHGRGVTDGGAPALPVIAADLAERCDLFVDEIVEDSGVDLQRQKEDLPLFLGALDAYGPRLGVDIAVTDAPR
jgi:uncharacterized protein (DUF2252 family)